jgi:alcohol dehydrogenase
MLAFADATMPLRDDISYDQAAPIFCAGYTVWSGLRWADPKPGERIAVVGIGGLGHLAVQYAKAAGFETIAVSHSPEKDRLILELGADVVVRDGESLGKAGGADVVLGTSNSADAMADAVKGLRPDGRLVVMGFEAKPLPVAIGDLIMRRIRCWAASKTVASICTRPSSWLPKARSRCWPRPIPSRKSAGLTRESRRGGSASAQL